jgi:hypothetical protein
MAVANRGEWDLVAGAVYFVQRDADPDQSGVFRLDLANDEQRRVSATLPSAIGTSLSVAADESFLVIAQTDQVDSDLILVPPPQP